jgi:hypothetical protein
MVGEGCCTDIYRDLFRPTGDFSHKLSIIVKEPGSRGEGIEKLFRQRHIDTLLKPIEEKPAYIVSTYSSVSIIGNTAGFLQRRGLVPGVRGNGEDYINISTKCYREGIVRIKDEKEHDRVQ